MKQKLLTRILRHTYVKKWGSSDGYHSSYSLVFLLVYNITSAGSVIFVANHNTTTAGSNLCSQQTTKEYEKWFIDPYYIADMCSLYEQF